MRKFYAKNKLGLTLAFSIALLAAVFAGIESRLIGVSAGVMPVSVDLRHLDFGTVFTGEKNEGRITVSYADDSECTIKYAITTRRKPLPEDHPDYPAGGDPLLPGFYRDLCPHLKIASIEDEEDRTESAFLSPVDTSDAWAVRLEVPALFNMVSQDHEYGVVTENGEYGCDIIVDTDGCSGGMPVCGDLVLSLPHEACDDGNTTAGDGCSADCQLEPIQTGGGVTLASASGGPGFRLATTENTDQDTSSSLPKADATGVLDTQAAPKLMIVKKAAVEFTNPGEKNVPYKIIIRNDGNLTAYNVKVEDILPSGFVFTGGASSSQSWGIGDLAPAGEYSIEYGTDVGKSVAAGRYTNTATVQADNNGRLSSSAAIEVRSPLVLGLELPASGFSIAEAALLLSLSVLAFYASFAIKKVV